MKEPTWILPETVLALHEQLLAEFGGGSGVRDPGLLESALTRPKQRFHYNKPSIFDLAAAYCFGLVKNHPFVDGNKRIAFAVAVVFLEINGYAFSATETDAVVNVLGLAAGELDEAACAAWLLSVSKKRRRQR